MTICLAACWSAKRLPGSVYSFNISNQYPLSDICSLHKLDACSNISMLSNFRNISILASMSAGKRLYLFASPVSATRRIEKVADAFSFLVKSLKLLCRVRRRVLALLCNCWLSARDVFMSISHWGRCRVLRGPSRGCSMMIVLLTRSRGPEDLCPVINITF